jgi:hypothetical protein
MSETIIIALLSFVGTVVGSLLGILAANKLTNYRLEQLEKKVEKHNNLVERMYNLETKVAVDEEEIEHLKNYHQHN